MMRNIWTIAKREYDHYFASPMAYVVGFIILFLLGLYFSVILLATNQQAFVGGGGTPPDVTPITWLFVFLAVFLAPALTMRLLSDEARMGTLELLLTAPVRDAELVIGKWLGSMLFMLTILAATLVYPLILQNFVSRAPSENKYPRISA
jgi:ABC-2 type transport system permease protein